MTALAALLGGIDPQALFSLFAVSVVVAVLGCSLALAISVRAAKTHEVLIAVLALWILWLLSLPIWSGMSSISGVVPPPDWFRKANPVAGGLCALRLAGICDSDGRRHLRRRRACCSRRHWSRGRSRRSAAACSSRPGGASGARDPRQAQPLRGGCRGRRSTAIPCCGANGIATDRRD